MKTTITEKANAIKPLPARMEDEARHTPGPWTALDHITVSEHTPQHVEVRGPRRIEAIADCFYGRSNVEMFANARLIAAAPELLAALNECLAQLEGPAGVWGDGRGNDGKKTGLSHDEFNQLRGQRLSNARSAIAKAKGQL